MNSKLIAAALIVLASGTAAASTPLSISDDSLNAFIDVTAQSAFESVVKVTPNDDLIMTFSAVAGAFSNVSYSFYTDASLTKTLAGDEGSAWTISDSNKAISFMAGGKDLKSFIASFYGVPLVSGTTYFVKFSGTLTSASGELKVTVGNGVVAAVPEPESYAMLLAGLGLMAAVARRRNRALQD